MNRARALLAALSLATAAQGAVQAPWPQFRGPAGSGVADAAHPPVEIGPDKNVKWKVAVPSGMSSPIIVDGKIVITAFEKEKLYTIAYDVQNGQELWRAEAPAAELEVFHKTENSPAASTCATDGARIVSYFGSCGLFCYDLAGKELWRYEMPPAKVMGNFGSGVSPILVDGVVVLLRDELVDPKIIAIDAVTGQKKWEKPRESKMGYCTPVAWETPEGKHVVAPGFGRMVGYDLQSGDEKWHIDGMPSACCASPVTADGDLYFAAWSPGAADDPDPENKMPSFDQILQAEGGDKDGDGAISKEESQTGQLKDFFENQDGNGDGLLTRDEWDGLVSMMASAKNSAFALKPGGTGEVSGNIRWKQTKGLPYVPTAIVYRGQQVMVKDGGVVTAYDVKTGEQVYHKRAVESGSYYASPVAADGHIYFTSLSDGVVTVVEAGGLTPNVLVKNTPLGERIAATPAIACDTLFVRTAGHLYAFAEKQ